MKMNKRKLASLIASLGLTSSVLVGCGSTPSVNKSDETYKEDEEQNDSSSGSGSGSSSNTNTNSNSHTVVPPVTGSKTTKNGVVSGSSKASTNKGSTGIGSGKGGASS
ncbi:hypothetical protein JFV29_09110 [Peribacillus sp. TH16]|uniref:hypothetical protein n=1 Tax=Peribacillus sp. TH16 TaxID=2798482 RepID=UPI001914B8C8|nr:hypothetical protein [Peribacillus sp. TH16]MBK5482080.1 hypothetical protein [Peribacillus sp. TH16]